MWIKGASLTNVHVFDYSFEGEDATVAAAQKGLPTFGSSNVFDCLVISWYTINLGLPTIQ